MKPRIEIMRRSGLWLRSELTFPNAREVYRYACALGRWIGNPRGDIAAVRVLHS